MNCSRVNCFLFPAVPSLDKFPTVEVSRIPGELIFGPGRITLNSGRKGIVLKVTNTGDRPIQVFNLVNALFIFYQQPGPANPCEFLLHSVAGKLDRSFN